MTPPSGPTRSFTAALSGLGFAEAVSRLSAWIGFVYLVQVLPPDRYGLLGIAASGINLLIPFVDIGWSAIGTREVASRPDTARGWLTAIIARRTIVAFVLFLLVGLAASYLNDTILGGLLVGHALFLFVGALTPDWYLAARERFALLAAARVVQSFSYVAMLILIVKGPGEILLQPLIAAGSYGLGILLMQLGVEKKTRRATRARIAGRESTLLFVGTYGLQNVINISLLAVGIWSGSDAAGLFNVGLRFWLLGGFVASMPSLVAGPRVARDDRGPQETLTAVRELLRLSFATSAALIVGGLLWAPLLVRLVAPAEYAAASSIVAVLVVGIGVQSVSFSVVKILVLRRRTNAAVAAQLGGAAVGIIVLAATLARTGAMAGALACVAAELTTALIGGWTLEKNQRLDSSAWRQLVPDVLAIGLVSVLLLAARSALGLQDGIMAGLITLTMCGVWWWFIRQRRFEGPGDGGDASHQAGSPGKPSH